MSKYKSINFPENFR